MRKSVIAVVVLSMIGLLPGASSATPTKAAVKLGAKCSKSGVTAQAGATTLICKRNSKKVLVWTKASKDCVDALKRLADMKKSYDGILTDLDKAETLLKDLNSGLTAADLKTFQDFVSQTKTQLPSIKLMVDSIGKQTQQLCLLG